MFESQTQPLGRNDPCSCGSGKKYKKCCLARDEAALHERAVHEQEQEHEHEAEDHHEHEHEHEHEHDEHCPECHELVELPPYLTLVSLERDEEPASDRCLPREVKALEQEEILARLARLGVETTPESFLAHSKTKTSAWAISEDWASALGRELAQRDQDFLGLAACELWRRLSAERPSQEMILDELDRGHDLNHAHDHTAACEAWLAAWAGMKIHLGPEVRSTDQLLEALPDLGDLYDWFFDLSDSLLIETEHRPSFADRAVEVHREICAQLADTEKSWHVILETHLAKLYVRAGRDAEAESAFRDVVRRFPQDLFPYLELASFLEEHGRLPEALAVLEEGKRVGATDEHNPGEPDRFIAELKRRIEGRPARGSRKDRRRRRR